MLVSLYSYDTTATTEAGIDTYAVMFANNTHWMGAPIAPNITDPALNHANKWLTGLSASTMLLALVYS